MIRYLVDTNIMIHVLNRSRPSVVVRMKVHHRRIDLSSIVLHELFFGAYNGGRPGETLEALAAIRFPVLDVEAEDARVAGEIRSALRRAGTPIGPLDVLIAGQALARDLTLVTNNTREFARVEGLRLEDWTLE